MLDGKADVLVHGANCQNTMGAGIALSIRREFPEAYAADCATPRGDRAKLGTFSYAEVVRGTARFIVVNAYTQFNYGGPGVRVDYDAVARAMAAIKQQFAGRRIAYPKIGAGLAGGDWPRLAAIIEAALEGEDHTLIEFDGTPSQGATQTNEAGHQAPAIQWPGSARHYAGIGSRQTPQEVLALMQRLAFRLAKRGFCLRTGGADGADTAFLDGCREAQGEHELWLPWKGFNDHDTGSIFLPSDLHYEKAASVHPAWDRLGRGPRALHARNVGQVLGADCVSPVGFVVAWTKDGAHSSATRSRATGGTGTAIDLASRHGIPVFNLQNAGTLDALYRHVQGVLNSL